MLPGYPEARRRQLAQNLLQNSLNLRRGEDLLIETWSATLPWAASLELEARMLGAHPLVVTIDEESYWQSVAAAPINQMGRVGEHQWAALKASDAYVLLYGPMDVVRDERKPPILYRRTQSNNHEFMQVLQKYGVRAIRWDLGCTHPLWARRYGVDLHEWRNELIEAALIDPRAMRRPGREIADRFRRGREITISHSNGTELTLRLAGRRPKLDDGGIDPEAVRAGNVYAVVPSGVASVTVNEQFAEGTFVSNATGVMFAGPDETPLGPARWSFRRGAVAGFQGSAAGSQVVRSTLRRLGRTPLHPGQVSIGLNPKISTIPLLFDQERGTITFEIGRNVMFGGKSRTPNLSAYLDLRGGSLAVDGETIVDRGQIAVP